MPAYARWIGFLIAGYSAIANDSIQTIGTFISSNKHRPWWLLWLFIGSIFIVTMSYSWITNTGDVSYGRLASKGFEQTPTSFAFFQISAPIFLLILTRLKMPVSTTFLILTSFATSSKSIGKVLLKSFTGYFLAFGIAFLTWLVISQLIKRFSEKKPHPMWFLAQWITSGLLWSVWLMQDAANIAVFLPRQLSLIEFLGFLIPIVLGLGFLLKNKGAKIQEVVEEKSRTSDVRSATVVDFIYAIILFYFKIHSKIPMSTTWVFLGLLGGREIAMSIRHVSKYSFLSAVKLTLKDASFALIGLAISFLVAMGSNAAMREQFLPF